MSIRGIIDAISQTKTGSHCALTLGKKAAGFVDESMAKWLLSRFPILQRRQLRDICLEVIGDLDEFFLRVERHLQDDARLPPANPEMMGLRTDPFGPELARVPRTLALPLGLLMAGVHVNGLAGNDMWLARRSITHGSFAGYLDTLAGGLIKADQPMESCLWEEAWQESGATRRDVVRIHAGPTYRYWSSTDAGIARGYVHVFDFVLTASFRPVSADGSNDAFTKIPVSDVLAFIEGGIPIKPVSCLAIFDFLQRRGCLQNTPHSSAITDFLARHRIVKVG